MNLATKCWSLAEGRNGPLTPALSPSEGEREKLGSSVLQVGFERGKPGWGSAALYTLRPTSWFMVPMRVEGTSRLSRNRRHRPPPRSSSSFRGRGRRTTARTRKRRDVHGHNACAGASSISTVHPPLTIPHHPHCDSFLSRSGRQLPAALATGLPGRSVEGSSLIATP